jgi:hypothetical protein
METNYGDGGSSFSYLPVVISDAIPENDFDTTEDETFTGTAGRNTALKSGARQSITVKGFLKGSGTASQVPELGKLFRLNQMSETNSSNTIYSPADGTVSSSCAIVNLDGIQYVISGARGESLKIEFEKMKYPTFECKLQGLWTLPSVVAFAAPTFTDSAMKPQIVQNLGMTIGGNTFVIEKLTLNLKSKLETEGSLNATNTQGVNEIAFLSREYDGTIVLKRDANSDIEYFSALVGATELAVASTGFGPAGNKISVSWSAFQVDKVTPLFVAGQQYYTVDFRINKSDTRAHELSITFA